ncbi:transmembrane protein 144b isoform X1 [Cynoglossus semilaevis]|uniref:transmembrane protein 144b isoform X1 n=1 Tax=Cynoglossus semilaevis TaxID=244447 RepID=UPI000496EF6C|nr:transmembrane protein 144 isoform X1 [Cynoglossus semilaevis]
MLRGECRSWLLVVASVLLLGYHSCAHSVQPGATVLHHAAVETIDLNFNSTNMTDFVYAISANVVAIVLYGSTFVPVKKIEMGDGMFFQWVFCAAVWVVSKIGDVILQSPKFYPLAMISGALWATGNLAVVVIVKAIGLSLGTLIWGSFSLLMGWASSRFGWFENTAQEVSKPILNYCGAALCLLSGLIVFFVKADVELHPNDESIPLLIDRRIHSGSYGPRSSEFWIDVIGPKMRRFIGCTLAIISGLLFGCTFTPISYIKSRSSCEDSVYYGASNYELDYVYAENCGIFLTSTVYFVIYCAAMRNRPRVYSRVVLPALCSGLMWALATYCWFMANNYLSAVITFPIVTAGYGLVAGLWGAVVFKEVKGWANGLIFFVATCVVLTGSVLTAISKL